MFFISARKSKFIYAEYALQHKIGYDVNEALMFTNAF